VELNDWILALHLLSAVALIGAQVVMTTALVSVWRSDDPARIATAGSVARVGVPLVMIGSTGTLVFGVWLAISLDRYELWDGWIIAALVLWAIGGYLGSTAGQAYGESFGRAGGLAAEGTTSSPELATTFGATRVFWMHAASVLVAFAILVLMIWKPGA
jgi:uncharacterized membrane protein